MYIVIYIYIVHIYGVCYVFAESEEMEGRR